MPTLPVKHSVLLTIVGLALLCVALAEARADVKDIPYTAQFASAAYPYARTVAGCTDWRRPDRLGDEWGPVSFAGACQEHDRCFHTPGASLAECNARFATDLGAACERDLSTERLLQGSSQGGKDRVGQGSKPDPQALKLCHEIVALYQARAQGRDVVRRFVLAQSQADAYLAYVRDVVSSVYQSVLRRAATTQEQDQALSALAKDYGLDDLKAALMGRRIDETAEGPAAAAAAAISASFSD